mmetsp:Transcript_5522/g.10542  ORF Transcript_5522/g.10542 Transcript_5522/m.10542 type:complete len:236 (+) Transcript_5522:98-805(+)
MSLVSVNGLNLHPISPTFATKRESFNGTGSMPFAGETTPPAPWHPRTLHDQQHNRDAVCENAKPDSTCPTNGNCNMTIAGNINSNISSNTNSHNKNETDRRRSSTSSSKILVRRSSSSGSISSKRRRLFAPISPVECRALEPPVQMMGTTEVPATRSQSPTMWLQQQQQQQHSNITLQRPTTRVSRSFEADRSCLPKNGGEARASDLASSKRATVQPCPSTHKAGQAPTSEGVYC